MNYTNPSIGIPPSFKPIYEKLFLFLDISLSRYYRLNSKETNEDEITEDLSIFLESEQDKIKSQHLINFLNNKQSEMDYLFRFSNQSKRSDIGVRLGREYVQDKPLLCWIEAKRLPTPVKHNRDEREYVFVSLEKTEGKRKFHGGGGIQRFKNNVHGKNLPYSVMIGYVQSNTFDFWENKIKSWINELIEKDGQFWNKSDLLIECNNSNCKKFISKHSRLNCDNIIELHHFWIYIN